MAARFRDKLGSAAVQGDRSPERGAGGAGHGQRDTLVGGKGNDSGRRRQPLRCPGWSLAAVAVAGTGDPARGPRRVEVRAVVASLHDRTEDSMPAPLAIPIVARVVLYGVVAGAVAAVGWLIKEIHKDDENQRQRRIRERDEEECLRDRNEDAV